MGVVHFLGWAFLVLFLLWLGLVLWVLALKHRDLGGLAFSNIRLFSGFLIKVFCAIISFLFSWKCTVLQIFGVNVCNVYFKNIKDPFGNKPFLGLKGLSLCISFFDVAVNCNVIFYVILMYFLYL